MGRRETQNIAKGIQQQALQRLAIPGCEQVVKFLLDEGPELIERLIRYNPKPGKQLSNLPVKPAGKSKK